MVQVSSYTTLEQPIHRTWVAVELIDTGCGMSAEQLVQIFQPFFTTKRAGRGTGLGLASALETVRAHGGDIKVESELKKGSRFTIELPVDGGAR
jgi:signal transduction histidine kinase